MPVNKYPSSVVKTAENNILFQDFLSFLKLLEKRSLGLTETGNLQRKEIVALDEIFKFDFCYRKKYGDLMYPPRTERNYRYLLLIRQITNVMYLVYKRSKKLRLSKNRRAYLNNIGQAAQYEQMVLEKRTWE
jgi:hypothetical protein